MPPIICPSPASTRVLCPAPTATRILCPPGPDLVLPPTDEGRLITNLGDYLVTDQGDYLAWST